MQSVPLGFQKEQVISVPVGNQLNGRQILARMRNPLTSDPSIIWITGTGGNLGKGKDRVFKVDCRLQIQKKRRVD